MLHNHSDRIHSIPLIMNLYRNRLISSFFNRKHQKFYIFIRKNSNQCFVIQKNPIISYRNSGIMPRNISSTDVLMSCDALQLRSDSVKVIWPGYGDNCYGRTPLETCKNCKMYPFHFESLELFHFDSFGLFFLHL